MLKLQKSRSLSEFSTFGIGGPIRYLIEVTTFEEMREAFHFAHSENIPYHILGKGSNSLFPDCGFEGLAILNKIDFCEWQEATAYVGSGYSFSLLGVQTARKGLSGLEFASGVPATVGGAIFMNAGANGHETSETLHSVTFLTDEGKIEEVPRSSLSFSYRFSPFQSMKGAILAARFHLQEDMTARPNQLKIIDYRIKTQPYKDKSAGCVFRNPAGTSAGALIDRCGLKGLSVGGARVSELHANFLINTGTATAKDMLALIQVVKSEVFKQTGIELEPEIRTDLFRIRKSTEP